MLSRWMSPPAWRLLPTVVVVCAMSVASCLDLVVPGSPGAGPVDGRWVGGATYAVDAQGEIESTHWILELTESADSILGRARSVITYLDVISEFEHIVGGHRSGSDVVLGFECLCPTIGRSLVFVGQHERPGLMVGRYEYRPGGTSQQVQFLRVSDIK